MVVFVGGRWEIFTPVTVAYEAGKTSGNDYIHANFVIWRVTFNEAGTITDAALTDSTTGELIAKLGQIKASHVILEDYKVTLDSMGDHQPTRAGSSFRPRWAALGTTPRTRPTCRAIPKASNPSGPAA